MIDQMADRKLPPPGVVLTESARRLTDRRLAVVVWVIAAILYLPGIWWGLPYASSPDRILAWGADELAPLGPVAELYNVVIARRPPYNPQYPMFGYLTQAVLVGPYVVTLWFSGRLIQPGLEFPFGLTDPVTDLAVMTLLARMVSLAMAAGVVIIAYETARILWDRTTGAMAAVLVSLTYPMFYYSRTSNVDMPALFWTALALSVAALCLKDRLTVKRAILLGIFAALATATKDASYGAFLFLGPAVLVQHVYRLRPLGVGRWQLWKPLASVVLSGLIVYVIASGLIFNVSRFLTHVDFILHGSDSGFNIDYYSGPPSIERYTSVMLLTGNYLIEGLGFPMFVFAVAGVLLSTKQWPPAIGMVLPAFGILVGVILPVRFVEFRFVMVIIYVLALFAAFAVREFLRIRRRSIHTLAQICAGIVCVWALVHGIDLTYQMIYDSRYEVSEWLARNAKIGDRIGYYGAPQKLPRLKSDIVTQSMPDQLNYYDPQSAKDPRPPEFVLLIPERSFETVHDIYVPESTYQGLVDESLGYRQVLNLQTPSLFPTRVISWVNPTVKVFVRKDYLTSLADVPPAVPSAKWARRDRE